MVAIHQQHRLYQQSLIIYEKKIVLDNVKVVGAYLEEQLDKIVEDFDNVKGRRGKGMMQGLVLETPVGDTIAKAIETDFLLYQQGEMFLECCHRLL